MNIIFKQYLIKYAGISSGITIGFLGTALLAVAVAGTVNTFVSGDQLDATKMNQNFTSLKTAIESIPNWTKSGNHAVFSGGNVTIGSSIPTFSSSLFLSRNTSNLIYGAIEPVLTLHNSSTTTDAMNGLIFANKDMFSNSMIVSFQNSGNAGSNMHLLTKLPTSTGWNTGQVTLASNSNVGINNTLPLYSLDVTGDMRTSTCLRYSGGTLGTCSSDLRLKKDIKAVDFKSPMEKISKLDLVQYNLSIYYL